jgi:hypothetical protein
VIRILRRWARAWRLFSFCHQYSQLPGPIHQREQEPVHIRVTRTKLIVDNRDLATAAGDSCGNPRALFRNRSERSSISFELGLVARVLLPAPDNTVRVFGIDLHEPGLPAAAFTADQC